MIVQRLLVDRVRDGWLVVVNLMPHDIELGSVFTEVSWHSHGEPEQYSDPTYSPPGILVCNVELRLEQVMKGKPFTCIPVGYSAGALFSGDNRHIKQIEQLLKSRERSNYLGLSSSALA